MTRHLQRVIFVMLLSAAVALFRFKRSVIQVIAASAVAGLILKTLVL